MTPRRNVILITTFVLIASLACSFTAIPVKSTPTPDFAATQAMLSAEAAAASTTTAVSKTTADAKATAAMQASVEAQATQAYLDGKATLAALETLNAKRKETKQAATEAVFVAATEQARALADQVEQLYNDNVLASTGGADYHLPDFEESWAQINWYMWWRQGLILDRFVIRADAKWELASNIANLFDSGCGFVFAENGENNHYASFLGLDGHVHNYRDKNGIFTELGGATMARLTRSRAMPS